MTHSTVTHPQMLPTHHEGEYPRHFAEMYFNFCREFPLGFQAWIITSIYLIDNIGSAFVSAGAMVKISVIFHCVVLGAELEVSVINELDERLLKIKPCEF